MEEGVYFFGGRDEQDEAFGRLVILKIKFNISGFAEYSYLEPMTQGERPSARYSHSQNYYREGNLLVVAYGRNDKDSIKQNIILDDLWILKLNK